MSGDSPSSDIVIVGGGPAGMMAGLLFARAGLSVHILEKHGDFLRDFRGDTVHPSTMEILHQLGMLEAFLKRSHSRVETAEVEIAGRLMRMGDLRHLKTPAPFIAMMPQWDFLDFLREQAGKWSGFRLTMEAEAAGFEEEGGRISGVRLVSGDIIKANRLVIATDGRSSLVRQQGLMPLIDLGAPMDVMWFALPKAGEGGAGLRGLIGSGRMMVMINRQSYWQCGWIIAKGSAGAVKSRGIGAFRAALKAAAPDLEGLDEALPDWNKVALLTVSLDRLLHWHRPGLLAIGDAAHAMSPIGGIGINLAIQDAVAAANLLSTPLLQGKLIDPFLASVQKRREWPTRVIQRFQKFAQDNVLGAILAPGAVITAPPLPVRLLNRFPLLRRIPGRMIGLGIRRERVTSWACQGAGQ